MKDRRRDKRGRPRKSDAKRRATTIAERAHFRDHGTAELVRRKRRIANGSGEPVELRDVPGILCAHDLIDPDELVILRLLAAWLRALALAYAVPQGGPAGLWTAITSGTGRPGWFVPPPGGARGADAAAFRLAQLFEHFAELRALDQLALVLRIALAEAWPADTAALAELRAGRRIIMELQRRGRGPRRRRTVEARHPAGAEA